MMRSVDNILLTTILVVGIGLWRAPPPIDLIGNIEFSYASSIAVLCGLWAAMSFCVALGTQKFLGLSRYV